MATKTLGTLSVNLAASTRRFSMGMSKAMQTVERFSAKAKAAAATAGAAFIGLGLPVVGAVKKFASFERQMTRIGAIAGATDEQFKELSVAARQMAATTEFSATQVADGMQFLAQAGFDVNKTLAATPKVLKLASTAMLDMGTAADITTNIMSGMGLSTDEMDATIDKLLTTVTGANTNMQQMGEAFKMLAPLASSVGFSVEETAAAVGALGNTGVQATMAGTGLSRAIANMIDPVDSMKEAADRLGLEFKNARGELLSFPEILSQLEKSGANATDMLQIFGMRGGRAMLNLAKTGSKGLQEFTDRIANSSGRASDIMGKVQNTVGFQLSILGSKFEEAALSIGEAFVPSFKSITDVAGKVLNVFSNLSISTRTQIANWTAIGLGVAGVITALSLLAAVSGPIVGGLAILFSPVLLSIGAVVAAVGLIVVAIGNVRQAWDDNVGGMRDKFEWFAASVRDIWSTTVEFWTDMFDGFIKGFNKSVEFLRDVFSSVKVAITGVEPPTTEMISRVDIEPAKPATEIIKDTFSSAVDVASDALSSFVDGLSSASKDAPAFLKEMGIKGADTILNPLGTSVEDIGGKAGELVEQLKELTKSATGASESLRGVEEAPVQQVAQEVSMPTGAMGEAVSSASGDFKSAMQNGAQQVVGAMQGAAGRIVTGALQGFAQGGPIGAIIGVIIAILTSLENFMKVIDIISSDLEDLFKAIDPLLDAFNIITKSTSNVFKGLFESLGTLFSAVADLMAPLAGLFDDLMPSMNIVGVLFELLGQVLGWLTPIFQVFAGIMMMVNMVVKSIINFILDLVTGVLDAIKFFLGWIPGLGGELQKAMDSVQSAKMEGDLASGNVEDIFRTGGGDMSKSVFRTRTQIAEDVGAEISTMRGAQPPAPPLVDEDGELIAEDVNDGLKEMAGNLQEVNEELKNIPAGLKVNRIRFDATLGEGAEFEGASRNVFNITMSSIDELANMLDSKGAFDNVAAVGAPTGGSEFGTDRRGS